jgi:hypothetical protein
MNGFTIPVSKDFNSSVGSEIDGTLANDFLVMILAGAVFGRG